MIFVGTSGWAYTAWRPGFYPAKLSPKKFLSTYATRLNTVEVNYSFRHYLNAKTQANWIADTPPNFKFGIKAHQAITHFRRLKDAAEPLAWFCNSVVPLQKAGKLGPVLFQLPPNMKADVALLSEFLGQLAKLQLEAGNKLMAAFEFRHASWFDESVFDVLRRNAAAVCLAESDDFVTPSVETVDFVYYRFRRSSYSPPERQAIAEKLADHENRQKTVFAFFKHEEQPEGVLWAEEVLNSTRKQLTSG